MAKEDFAVGLLQGLYESGLGNPDVQDRRRQSALQEAYYKQRMNAEAADQGMVPAHPIMRDSGFLSALRASIFGDNSDLQTSFVPDPNQPSGYVDAEGNLSTTQTPGSTRVPPKEFREAMIKKGQAPNYTITNWDPVSGQPSGFTNLPPNMRPAPSPRPPLSDGDKTEQRLKAKRKLNQPIEKRNLDRANQVFDDIIREANAIKNHKSFDMATGGSAWTGILPGTGARNVRKRSETLLSKSGLQTLQDIRASSPTGGALGNVSDRDVQLIQNAIANLDPYQKSEDVKAAIDRIIDYANKSKQRFQEAYNDMYGGDGGGDGGGIPIISSDEEFNALPPGSVFLDGDGVPHTKK